LKFVYVVDAEDKVQTRRVSTGSLQEDGLRVITDGLEANEWVVVGGLQQVRQHMQIKPDRMPMPTLAASRTGKAPAGEPKQPPEK
jgi:membrane fusion protein, multidrug efflux system